jgi:hypothetical protein
MYAKQLFPKMEYSKSLSAFITAVCGVGTAWINELNNFIHIHLLAGGINWVDLLNKTFTAVIVGGGGAAGAFLGKSFVVWIKKKVIKFFNKKP